LAAAGSSGFSVRPVVRRLISMRGILFVLMCCASGLLAGCATMSDGTLKARDHDYRDDANDATAHHDEWDTVRKEGRGAEATEQEWDSWTKSLMSPKAMAIERNLGYGY
jgi:hypothetical protein